MTRSVRAAAPGSSRGDAARQHREGFCQQRVAAEDRHALAVHDVQGGQPAAEHVVVHRGQVIVHERVGVNQLEGAREGHRLRTGLVRAERRLADGPDRFRRGKREQRPQALAAGAHAVAHGVGDERRAGRRRGELAFERILDRRAPRVDPPVQPHIGLGHVVAHREGPSARLVGGVGAEGCGRRFQLPALVEDFDAALDFFELPMAEAGQRHAALVQGERRFEREVAIL